MTGDEHHSSTAKGAGPAAREVRPTRNSPAGLSPGHRGREGGPHTPYSVELHIGELVLDGVAAGDRYRVGDAMERELARLFIERGAVPSQAEGGEIPRLDGGAFELRPGSGPEAIGVHLAQAIYEALNR